MFYFTCNHDDLKLSPFAMGHVTYRSSDHRIRNIWFSVCGQIEPTVYLARLSRYVLKDFWVTTLTY